MTLDESIKEFCQDMCRELDQDPEKEWRQYRDMAKDHFVNEAYARVRKLWWNKPEPSKDLMPPL